MRTGEASRGGAGPRKRRPAHSAHAIVRASQVMARIARSRTAGRAAREQGVRGAGKGRDRDAEEVAAVVVGGVLGTAVGCEEGRGRESAAAVGSLGAAAIWRYSVQS